MKNKSVASVVGEEHYPDCDARTLADAKVIEDDPKRLAAAQKAAKDLAQRKTEEAAAMHRVAGTASSPEKKRHSSGMAMVDSKVRVV